MTPEAQRIAIAQVCGWRRHKLGGITRFNPWCHKDADGEDYKNWKSDTQLPDYLSDLNAMHEAEKVLTEDKSDTHGKDQRCRFITHLGEIVGCWKPGQTHNSLFQQAHATAAQRAEAFLRCLGKWEGK